MKKLIREHLLDIVIVLMFVVGLSVLLYPSVSSYVNAKHASRAIALYSSSVDQASDEAIIVTDRNGKVIFAYDPDKDETTGSNNRGYRGAVISSPEFKTGEVYNVYIGGDVEGTDTDGLYDISTVTGFSGAVRQAYTGTDVRGFGPSGRMGGRPGELPEGEFPGRPMGGPDGGFPGGPMGGPDGRPEPPEGGFPGRPMGGPRAEFTDVEGFTMNEDGSVSITAEAAQTIAEMLKERDPNTDVTAEEIETITDMDGLFRLMMSGGPMGAPMGGPEGQNTGEARTDFFMNDTVNAFSGVTDEETIL